MQINDLREKRLRELAGIRADGASVLSIFLNLDPREFAAAPARATEISSVLDDAHRRIRDTEGLSHDARKALRDDLERARELFRDFAPKGAHGFALFACGPASLFEGMRLPRPIETRAVIDDSPFVEPLVDLVGAAGEWMVVLVNRSFGRLLRGDADHLDELAAVEDDVHGRHKQGGWSQARYQRSVDEEVADHLKHVADAAFLRFKRAPFQHLLLGGPSEALAEFEGKLHPYLRERLRGRFDVDVEHTNADEVAAAARPKIEQFTSTRERDVLDRVREGVAKGGRGAAGLDQVLSALNERRVETLLLNQGYSAQGCTCPQCGCVYSLNGGKCPADGSDLDCRGDVIESAVHLALEQDAGVLVVREEEHARELQSHGSIAAVLRF
jgi:peptide subunit release factor 1 (eRF1)